jgi:hypothetical protein
MDPLKIVGYVMLIIGLIVLIIPPFFGLAILFRGGSVIPKILQTPVLSNSTTTSNSTIISTTNLNQMIKATFPAVNLVLLFIISLVLIYAGGVIMSKGVNLITDARLRPVRDTSKQASGDEVKKEKATTPEEQ